MNYLRNVKPGVTGNLLGPRQSATNVVPDANVAPKSVAPQKLISVPQQPLYQGQRSNLNQVPTLPQSTQPNYLGQKYSDYKDIGIENLKSMAEGKNPYLDKIEQKSLGQQAASSAAQASANQQRFAQQGLSPEAQNTMLMRQQRADEMAAGGIRQDISEQKAIQQQQATNQLIQQATQAEQFEKAEQLEAFNSLISAGGAENIAKATEIFNTIYGTPLDTHQIQQTNMQKTLGQYASMPGITVDEAIQMAREQGDLDFLGIDEVQARAFLDPIMSKSNPLSQAQAEYSTMLKNGQITQDEYDQMMVVAKHMVTQPDGYEVSDAYQVTDKDGNVLASLKTQQEADAFKSKNPDAFSIDVVKNGMVNKKGEYKKYLPYDEGEMFDEKGTLYMIEDGEQIKVNPDWDDPFSLKNQKIIENFGDEVLENKMGKKLITKQVKTLLGDINQFPSDMDKDGIVYQELIKDPTLHNVIVTVDDRLTVNDPAGLDTNTISEFSGLNQGDMTVINGRLYYLSRTEDKDYPGDNQMRYYFKDPITNEEYWIEAPEDDDMMPSGTLMVPGIILKN